MSDETVRKEFNRGELRSELKIAIPCLRGGDIEWIVALFVSELQASRSAAIQECADSTHCYMCQVEIEALKER
jgi:hypothetical protein